MTDPAAYDARKPLIIDPVLSYSTYLGGSGEDESQDIAVDAAGHAYVTGNTTSTDFPTANAVQPQYGGGGQDAFVAKLSADGSALVYATYLGGSGAEGLPPLGTGSLDGGMAVDAQGNAYVTGTTTSTDFPTVNAFQPRFGGGNFDVFLTKLSGDGTLVYSTYLGGITNDRSQDVAVDAEGNAYAVGLTNSSDFPLVNPFQETYAGGTFDVFVTKFSADGSALVYSTYLGGNSNDQSRGIGVDGEGHAYVTGFTPSPDFPLANPLQPEIAGSSDVFVTKLSADGSALVYSTYLGGSGGDNTAEIAVDAQGNAYVVGNTSSTNFPTANALLPRFGGGSQDGFVTKLSADGSALVYSTYLGGDGSEQARGVAADGDGNAYVAGFTNSLDFPLVNALQPEYGGGGTDGFVTKLDPAGSSFVYSTYLGGSEPDPSTNIAVDAGGNAYVAGWTASTNFPTVNPLQPEHAGGRIDIYVAKIGDCAEEVTNRVRVTRFGFYYNPRTRRFSQLVWVTNISRSPIQGPLSLVLTELTPNVTLVNRSGVTTCAPPLGSPYKDVNVGRDNVLKPREGALVVLEFTTPSFSGITYRPRVLAGAGNR